MILDDILSKLEIAYKHKKPFVIYRKPNDSIINALFQLNDKLFYLDNFSQTGFVFAPFDNREKTIFFPLKECEIYAITFPTKYHSSNKNDSVIPKYNRSKSKEDHIKLIQNGIDFIKKGNVSKVVLSRKEEVEFKNKKISEIFQNLLINYISAFVYIWYHPKVGLWMGATPETLLRVENKEFKTMALAATQPFTDSIEVHWGEKEKEEQLLVTNFIVTQLKRFDIKVSKPFTTKAGSLLHICTKIQGKLNSNNDLKIIINKLHPTPAVCGLPVEKSKIFILKNEQYNREFYTGFLGELNFNNLTNLFVNLRCMQVANKKATIYIGGGITIDSIAENEWEETISKSEVMKKVL